MKILTSEQIRRIDAETIAREGIPSRALMKRAATAFFNHFVMRYPRKDTTVLLLAGMGNNGGDALVTARLLHRSGYGVKVWMVEQKGACSEDCAHQLRRVKAENIACGRIRTEQDIPAAEAFDVIIDGIFGTGLSREVSGVTAKVIEAINESGRPVFSIDVPSGLFLDRKTSLAVRATETVTFQIPKLALFLPENSGYTGILSIVPIGLREDAIAEAESRLFYTEPVQIRDLLKPLRKFAHKGTEGHALLIGGSLGKCGSVCLASRAALKTGCGLVTTFLPKCGMGVIQSCLPEAMAIEDPHPEHITDISYRLQPDAIGIGTGMGQHADTEQAFRRFLDRCHSPLVIDADGINILAKHPEWLPLLPPKTIVTPHPKELSRLVGEWHDDYEKIEKTWLFAKKYDLIVVVKGAYSLVMDAEELHVNSSGTPALATAGSGDVLTGMITSLLAQGYSALEAARVGVYLHGLTADLTRDTIHPRSFLAGDIISHIGQAYHALEKKR
ncbi:MAG: NAD(P)H-hydrate dehydratase [Proteiniphilum sp.]|nr:NAD(P)H-hydrate dehydratase [Proteiniphilum sp.]MDD4158404.1 NAD(P)H-hydrate dehydratase [Proteiniphilum sp.]MDD4799774.1 NAD(P)H-hydrate dehydratase [Proteiniphilum sp.]